MLHYGYLLLGLGLSSKTVTFESSAARILTTTKMRGHQPVSPALCRAILFYFIQAVTKILHFAAHLLFNHAPKLDLPTLWNMQVLCISLNDKWKHIFFAIAFNSLASSLFPILVSTCSRCSLPFFSFLHFIRKHLATQAHVKTAE